MSGAMQVDVREAEGRSCLTVSGELTIYAASDACAALSVALDAARDIVIDLSGVSEFDGSGLQLLRACAREAALRGLAFDTTGHPPELRRTMDLLGLSSTLDDLVKDDA